MELIGFTMRSEQRHRHRHRILDIELAEELNRKKERKHIVKCRHYVCVCLWVCNEGQLEGGGREPSVAKSNERYFVPQFMWTSAAEYCIDTSTMLTNSPAMWTCRRSILPIGSCRWTLTQFERLVIDEKCFQILSLFLCSTLPIHSAH